MIFSIHTCMTYLKKVTLTCACLAVFGGGAMWAMNEIETKNEYDSLTLGNQNDELDDESNISDESNQSEQSLLGEHYETMENALKKPEDNQPDLWLERYQILCKNETEHNESNDDSETSCESDTSSETSEDCDDCIIHDAVSKNIPENVKLLLEWKTPNEINQTYKKLTPLDYAVQYYAEKINNKVKKTNNKINAIDNRKIIQLLLTCEKVDAADKENCVNNLFCEAAKKSDQDTIGWIIRHAPKEYCGAFLINAVQFDNLLIVKMVYNKGFNNINAIDQYGKTPLHYAADNGNLKIVEFLCEDKDIRLDVRDNQGKIPLHYATQNNNKVIAKLLIKNGANQHTWDNNGIAPCDLMPKLKKQESWFSWITNRVPEIANNVLTGIVTGTAAHYLYNPKAANTTTLSLLVAGLIGTHLVEQKIQKNFTVKGYYNRNFNTKFLLGIAGALSTRGYQKFTGNDKKKQLIKKQNLLK